MYITHSIKTEWVFVYNSPFYTAACRSSNLPANQLINQRGNQLFAVFWPPLKLMYARIQ